MRVKRCGTHWFDESVEPIGRGAFSRVYKGFDGHDHIVAIKVIEMPRIESRVLQEIDIMRHLKHPNVVRLYDIQYERTSNQGMRIFIVMEFCGGGDFSKLPKPLGEEMCQTYFHQMVSGLRYLHKRGIVHRDIKPQNVLLTNDNQVKLADFTFAKQMQEQEMMETMCGTPVYIAPEVLSGEMYDSRCDLWSLGVMLYQFLYGTHPLGTIKSHNELAKRIRSTKITFPEKLVIEKYESQESGRSQLVRTVHHFSPECLELARGLLQKHPSHRMTWEHVCTSSWLELEQDPLFCQEVPQHACSAPVLTETRPPPPVAQVAASPRSFSASPDAWGFNMSEDEPASRIIADYTTSTTPPKMMQPKFKRSSSSLLTRSIDALHRVFY